MNRQSFSNSFFNHSCIQETNRENLLQERDVFYQFQHFIQENYSDDQLDLGTIAKAMCMSEIQLYRKLKEQINQSPINYLRSYRLQKAIELLANSNTLSISEIAYRVGFSDPNYFSRVFSSTFDRTPTEYRKMAHETYL